MKVINILVTDKLKVTSVKDGDKTLNANIPVEIPSGNYRSVALNFTFDSKTWEEVTLTKYATFSVEGGDKVQVMFHIIF